MPSKDTIFRCIRENIWNYDSFTFDPSKTLISYKVFIQISDFLDPVILNLLRETHSTWLRLSDTFRPAGSTFYIFSGDRQVRYLNGE